MDSQIGFSLGYTNMKSVQITSSNLKLTIGDHIDLWNKVMKEVKLKRYAGPLKSIPFEDDFIQSPIGLVPKDNGKDIRLIFHLSYPHTAKGKPSTSVNANTPEHLCKVKYPEFSDAVLRCLQEGRSCKLAKSDNRSAFRNLGIKVEHFKYLIMGQKVLLMENGTILLINVCPLVLVSTVHTTKQSLMQLLIW